MLKLFAKKNNKKGFTLVELVVVIAILGILAAITVPRLLGFQQRAREQADKQTAVQIRNAVALLHANGEIYPDANGTTFTVADGGTLTYASGDTLYKDKDRTTTVANTAAQALIIQLTGAIDLQSTTSIVQITLGSDGEVSQTLVPAPGTVVQEGTPVNATNLNKLEQGLASHTAEKATEQNYGHVKVDGETITASNGIISAQTQIVDTVTGTKWQWSMEDGIVFLEKVVD